MSTAAAYLAAFAVSALILLLTLIPPRCGAVSPYGVDAGYVLAFGCDRPRR